MTKLWTLKDARTGGRHRAKAIRPRTPHILNPNVLAVTHPETLVVGKVNEHSFKKPKAT